ACVAGAQSCTGGAARSAEVCNGLDDDCDGTTDDLPQAGVPCSGAGINTAGACRAAYACVGGAPGPGPSGLTCVQTIGPTAELCNGVDDNCDGLTDNA